VTNVFHSTRFLWLLLASCLFVLAARAEDQDSRASLDSLRKEVQTLRDKVATAPATSTAAVDQVLENKYGPNATVTTRTAKIKSTGVVQTWFYHIQNDNRGVLGDLDTNETRDNDSFRPRRQQLFFWLDINENVRGLVMFNPANELASFPAFDTNVGTSMRGAGSAAAVKDGAGAANTILQDASINFVGVVPHHDFTVGQMLLPLGEEGPRSSGALDFVERSWAGQKQNAYDIGAMFHGAWWTDGKGGTNAQWPVVGPERLQYWVGLYNSPGNLHGSSGSFFWNRSDDNDQKDLVWRVMVRPVWKSPTWGDLELGFSGSWGQHGESGDHSRDASAAVNGLDRLRTTNAIRYFPWAYYAPGGPAKGLWVRAEYAWLNDRNAPGAVRGFDGGFDPTVVQTNPSPFSVQGWYAAIGYHLGNSIFKDKIFKQAQRLELAFRYQQFQNVTVADLVMPESRTDVFSSTVITAGLNYYIRAKPDTKIQLNYSWAGEDVVHNTAARNMRHVGNDSLVLNFQVAW
jgi:hypothetical protein